VFSGWWIWTHRTPDFPKGPHDFHLPQFVPDCRNHYGKNWRHERDGLLFWSGTRFCRFDATQCTGPHCCGRRSAHGSHDRWGRQQFGVDYSRFALRESGNPSNSSVEVTIRGRTSSTRVANLRSPKPYESAMAFIRVGLPDPFSPTKKQSRERMPEVSGNHAEGSALRGEQQFPEGAVPRPRSGRARRQRGRQLPGSRCAGGSRDEHSDSYL